MRCDLRLSAMDPDVLAAMIWRLAGLIPRTAPSFASSCAVRAGTGQPCLDGGPAGRNSSRFLPSNL